MAIEVPENAGWEIKIPAYEGNCAIASNVRSMILKYCYKLFILYY